MIRQRGARGKHCRERPMVSWTCFIIYLILSTDSGVQALRDQQILNPEINTRGRVKSWFRDSKYVIKTVTLRALSGELHTFYAAILSVIFDQPLSVINGSNRRDHYIETQRNSNSSDSFATLKGLTRLICGTSLFESFSAVENNAFAPFPLHLTPLEKDSLDVHPIVALFGIVHSAVSSPISIYHSFLLLNYTITDPNGKMHIVDINLSESILDRCVLRFLPPAEQIRRPFGALKDNTGNIVTGDVRFPILKEPMITDNRNSTHHNSISTTMGKRQILNYVNLHQNIVDSTRILNAFNILSVDTPEMLQKMACQREVNRINHIALNDKKTKESEVESFQLTGNIAVDAALMNLHYFDDNTLPLTNHQTIYHNNTSLSNANELSLLERVTRAKQKFSKKQHFPGNVNEYSPRVHQLSNGNVFVDGGYYDHSMRFSNVAANLQSTRAPKLKKMKVNTNAKYQKYSPSKARERYKETIPSIHSRFSRQEPLASVRVNETTVFTDSNNKDNFKLNLDKSSKNAELETEGYINTVWDKTLLSSKYKGIALGEGRMNIADCVHGSRKIKMHHNFSREISRGDSIICGNDVTNEKIHSINIEDPTNMYILLTKKYPGPDQLGVMLYKISDDENSKSDLNSVSCLEICTNGCSESADPISECGACLKDESGLNCFPGSKGFPPVGCERLCNENPCFLIEKPIIQCGACPLVCTSEGIDCCNRKSKGFSVQQSSIFQKETPTCVKDCRDSEKNSGCESINNFSIACSDCTCGLGVSCCPKHSTWPKNVVPGMPYSKPLCKPQCKDPLIGGCSSIPDSTIVCGACDSEDGGCNPKSDDWPAGGLPGIPLSFTPPQSSGGACSAIITAKFDGQTYSKQNENGGKYNDIRKSLLKTPGILPDPVKFINQDSTLAGRFSIAIPRLKTGKCPPSNRIHDTLKKDIDQLPMPPSLFTVGLTSKISLPFGFTLPKFPDFNLPSLTEINMPGFKLPEIPKIKIPTFNFPPVNLPNIPIPGVPLPNPIPPTPEPYPDPLEFLMKILMIILGVVEPIIMPLIDPILDLFFGIILDILIDVLSLLFAPAFPVNPPNFPTKINIDMKFPTNVLPDVQYPEVPPMPSLPTTPTTDTTKPKVPGVHTVDNKATSEVPAESDLVNTSKKAETKSGGASLKCECPRSDPPKGQTVCMKCVSVLANSCEITTAIDVSNKVFVGDAISFGGGNIIYPVNAVTENSITLLPRCPKGDVLQGDLQVVKSGVAFVINQSIPSGGNIQVCDKCAVISVDNCSVGTSAIDLSSKVLPGDAVRFGTESHFYSVEAVAPNYIKIRKPCPKRTTKGVSIFAYIGLSSDKITKLRVGWKPPICDCSKNKLAENELSSNVQIDSTSEASLQGTPNSHNIRSGSLGAVACKRCATIKKNKCKVKLHEDLTGVLNIGDAIAFGKDLGSLYVVTTINEAFVTVDSKCPESDQTKVSVTISTCENCATIKPNSCIVVVNKDLRSKLAPGDAVSFGKYRTRYGVTAVGKKQITLEPECPKQGMVDTSVFGTIEGFTKLPIGVGIGLTASDEWNRANTSDGKMRVVLRGKDSLNGVAMPISRNNTGPIIKQIGKGRKINIPKQSKCDECIQKSIDQTKGICNIINNGNMKAFKQTIPIECSKCPINQFKIKCLERALALAWAKKLTDQETRHQTDPKDSYLVRNGDLKGLEVGMSFLEQNSKVKESMKEMDQMERASNSIDKLEEESRKKLDKINAHVESLKTKLLVYKSEENWQKKIAELQSHVHKLRGAHSENQKAYRNAQYAKIKMGRSQFAGRRINAGFGTFKLGEFDQTRFKSERTTSNEFTGYNEGDPEKGYDVQDYPIIKKNVAKKFDCEKQNCVINMAFRSLSPLLVAGVSGSVSAVLKDLINDSVSEMLPEVLRDHLANALDRRITKPLLNSLTPVLVDKIATSVVRTTPSRVVRKLTKGLLHTLPLALTHSLVPAVTHTMSHNPIQDYYCYYCYKHQLYCQYCTYAPLQLYYSQIYASYYGQYYANYYSGTYSYLLTKKSPRRSDTSWTFSSPLLPG